MQISLDEYGLGYVIECFKRYQGDGFFVLLFVLAILYLAFYKKDKSGRMFLGYVAVLTVTVYNILVMQYVIRILNLSNEYYRFLWLLPVAPITAYAMVCLVRSQNKKAWKMVSIMAVTILAISAGNSVFSNSWSFVENIYKIPNEIIEISQIIHGDSNKEQPRAAVEFDVATMLNQYDPSIVIAVPYGETGNMRYYTEQDAEWNLPPYEQSKYHLYQGITENLMLEGMEFAGSLKYCDVDYMVIARADGMEEYFLSQSCEIVGRTKSYDIYRFIYYE